jgi:zinc/manganese transport system permease protein
MIDTMISPFMQFEFMQRALTGCIALAAGSAPVGVFVTLRRMSLTGDAIAHAILPGVAITYLLTGLSLLAMTLGGMLAGMLVGLLATLASRRGHIREDSHLAAFYLMSLALGVIIISIKGGHIDLMHVLFGSVLALDNPTLGFISAASAVSLVLFLLSYRRLTLECVDPGYSKRHTRSSLLTHAMFMMMVVLNLMAGFHALGTLMAIGVMILPAVIARLCFDRLHHCMLGAVLVSVGCSWVGLSLSFRWDTPAGPTIIMLLGLIYIGAMGWQSLRRWTVPATSGVAMLLLLTSPGETQARESTEKSLDIVVTFSVLADITQNIGGEHVSVISLVGPDADGHTYEPTPSDARRLSAADLVITHGMGFEGWIDRLVSASGFTRTLLVVSEGLDPLTIMTDNGNVIDPHTWQDPMNVIVYVNRISAVLGTLLPSQKASFDSNAARYKKSLLALHDDTEKAFSVIPPGARKVCTSHDAFGYFGHRYGVEFIAPAGISTDSEPSMQDVARIIKQIKRKRLRAVFVENISDPRMQNIIAAETGVTHGGTLYSDALSGPDGPASTYIAMVRHNTSLMLRALAAGPEDNTQ